MEKRLLYRLLVSVLTLVLIFIWGNIGFSFFAFMGLELLLFKKRKIDEREVYLLYQAGNATAITFFVLLFVTAYFLLYSEIEITKELFVVFCIMLGVVFTTINSAIQLIILKKG